MTILWTGDCVTDCMYIADLGWKQLEHGRYLVWSEDLVSSEVKVRWSDSYCACVVWTERKWAVCVVTCYLKWLWSEPLFTCAWWEVSDWKWTTRGTRSESNNESPTLKCWKWDAVDCELDQKCRHKWSTWALIVTWNDTVSQREVNVLGWSEPQTTFELKWTLTSGCTWYVNWLKEMGQSR